MPKIITIGSISFGEMIIVDDSDEVKVTYSLVDEKGNVIQTKNDSVLLSGGADYSTTLPVVNYIKKIINNREGL